MINGELAHSCSHGPAPHQIKVFITKNINNPLLYNRLAEKAGQKPAKRKIKCKTAAIKHVKKSQQGISEIELLDILEADDYNRESAFRTLRMLASYGNKIMKKNIDGNNMYFIPDQKLGAY